MLVLASQSPRRRQILARAGIPFVPRAGAEIEESPKPGEDPRAYVMRLAKEKAEAVPISAGEIILCADTTVAVDGDLLGKPTDAADAARMLGLLSGRSHDVVTGICLRSPAESIVDAETTHVWFAPLSAQEIRDYVASGEPMDKAGAYAIQGLASKFIERIEGCYWNVVGLPVALVYRHLRRWGKL